MATLCELLHRWDDSESEGGAPPADFPSRSNRRAFCRLTVFVFHPNPDITPHPPREIHPRAARVACILEESGTLALEPAGGLQFCYGTTQTNALDDARAASISGWNRCRSE